MKCPQCGKDLGVDLLPARCPSCGANLRDRAVDGKVTDPAASRRQVEGLTGIGKGNTRDRGRYRGRLVVALVLMALFCAGLVWGVGRVVESFNRVPDVVGWRYERAADELSRLGYGVEREDVVAPETEVGLVVSADVPPGNEGTARLRVSAKRVMPDVVGLARDDAARALDEAGVPYEFEEQVSDQQDGTVLSASLEAGREVRGETVVTLAVARRPVVPDVNGYTRAEAVKALTEAGLKAEFVSARRTDGHAVGTVVSCDPAPGTTVPAGSAVTLAITSARAALSEATAEAALSAVYNAVPSGDSVGTAVAALLSPSSPYAGRSAHDVWYGLVKGGGAHGDVDARIQSLPRSMTASTVEVSDDGASATAVVSVHWDWSPLGGQYSGVTSDDTHYVTMTFDDDGRLLTFHDPQTDVPTYQVVEY